MHSVAGSSAARQNVCSLEMAPISVPCDHVMGDMGRLMSVISIRGQLYLKSKMSFISSDLDIGPLHTHYSPT